jgi:hypothetical protein
MVIESLNLTEIIVAALGTIGLIGAAYYTKQAKNAKEEAQEETYQVKRELKVSATALGGFGGLMQAFGEVEREVQDLCKQTDITRVVVLCAWNGKHSPKWTTSVWQYRQLSMDGTRKPVSYIHVGLDDDYVHRLRQMKASRSLLFKTADAPNSLIQRIYESEEVNESLWVYLSTGETLDETEGKLITYMSFATQGGSIDSRTRLLCELLAGRLAPLTGNVDAVYD